MLSRAMISTLFPYTTLFRSVDGYTVGTGSNRHPGTGKGAASGWLAQLRAAVPHGELLGLPYADPDVVAMTRAGLTTDAQRASSIGQKVLAAGVSAPPSAVLSSFAWPPGGFADRNTLDAMSVGGVSTVLLDSAALPVTGGDQSLTPGAHAEVRTRDDKLDAVLTDHRLSTAVDNA